jgi:CDP-diacylglycerol--glycerol-3-phosphate 3-phosphatidyltransferase
MNLPNKLTLSRLALTVAFLVVFLLPLPGGKTLALALFLVASITDHYDGKIARQRKLITNFGILMDPLADKVLVCSAFIAFVGDRLMPAWMVILIVARELTITGLRLLAASKNVVLAAEGYGKHKTVSQMVTIVAILVLEAHGQWGAWARTLFEFPVLGVAWVQGFTVLSMWASVFFTAFSGAIYLYRNQHIYMSDF